MILSEEMQDQLAKIKREHSEMKKFVQMIVTQYDNATPSSIIEAAIYIKAKLINDKF